MREEAGRLIDVHSGLPQAQPYLVCIKAEALRCADKHYTPTTISEEAVREVMESGQNMMDILREMHEEGFWG